MRLIFIPLKPCPGGPCDACKEGRPVAACSFVAVRKENKPSIIQAVNTDGMTDEQKKTAVAAARQAVSEANGNCQVWTTVVVQDFNQG